MLSFDRTTWYEFLADKTSGFPRPVKVGTTPSGKPRHRWKKFQVIAWYESLEHDHEAPDEPPKKKSEKS